MLSYYRAIQAAVRTNIRNSTLGNHGPRTLLNSAQNSIFYNLVYIGLFVLYLVKFDELFNQLIFAFTLFMALASSTYRVSEIKHLVDGISTNNESRTFFIKTFWSGIYHMTYIVLSFLLYKLHALTILIIIILSVLCFIFGMMDLFQTRDIDRTNRGYLLNQIFYSLGIPYNFLRFFFSKSYRMESLSILCHNLSCIWKGIEELKASHKVS
ncbi:hypothetical protein D3C76_792510 [compost metagenome]